MPHHRKTSKMIERGCASGTGGISLGNMRTNPDPKRHLNGFGPASLNKTQNPAILPALFTIFLSLNLQLNDPEI
jgi:hypothetical protein